MEVGMSEKSLTPSVEHCHKSDVGAQVFGISRDLEEGLGSSPKQQAVIRALFCKAKGARTWGRVKTT